MDTTTEASPPPRQRRPRNSVRDRYPRKRTIAAKRITRNQLAAEWVALGMGINGGDVVEDQDRPRKREECREAARPCPYVSCKHHLYLDINPETGSITLNFPDLEPWELNKTCSLDVADLGGITLEEVGEIMNITRERVRQIETRALIGKLRPTAVAAGLEGAVIDVESLSPLASAQEREIDVQPSEVTYQTI